MNSVDEYGLLRSITQTVQDYCKENKLTKTEAQLVVTLATSQVTEAIAEGYWNHIRYRELMGKSD